MASTTTNRRQGINTGAAVKVPCKAATTANITLSGEQTIDGVSCVDGDRVLVKEQTTAANNGIYVVSTSTWQRDKDFDGTFDVVQGTLIPVANGTTNGGQMFRVTTANPITIGTTSLAFTYALDSSTMTYTPTTGALAGVLHTVYSFLNKLGDAGTNLGAALIGFLQSGTGATARTVSAKLQDYWVSVKDFGAVGDASTDDTSAIQSAITALITAGKGGVVYFPRGAYKVTSQIEVDGHGIYLVGEGQSGYYDTTARPLGSYILVGGDITGDVIVFGSASTTYQGGGVRNLGFVDVGTSDAASLRNYAVTGAALHVKRCDAISISGVRFVGIRGGALKTTRCVKGDISDVDVAYCGATSLPAVELAGTSSTLKTQATRFAGFRIEVTCGGADSLKISSNDVDNKFFGFGFETAALTSSQGAETVNGIFLNVGGANNQFSTFHLNAQGTGGSNPKMQVTATKCIFKSFKFAGARPAANVYLNSAQQCVFDDFVDVGASGNEAQWMFEMANSCTLNTIDNVYGASTSGISVNSSSTRNTISARFSAGSGSVLTCAGTQNLIEVAFSAMTGTGTLVTVSGALNDVKVEAHSNTAVTSEVVLVSASSSTILPGSRIYNSQLAHGIRITGSNGKFDGIEVNTVGKTGIIADGGEPASISNNHIIDAGRATAATYYGISLESASNKTTGGVCNGNRVRVTSGSLAAAIFTTDNGGSPRYDFWTFEGNNVRNGGTISVSKGNNIIRNNIGYITEASGTGSIASGATTATVTHGLAVTPTLDDISITFGEQGTNDYGRFWVDTIGATTFQVNVSADPGASNLDFGWKATCW